MATTKSSKSTSQVPTQSPEVALCDPCQVRERGSTAICGFQGRSLGPHLKKHKDSRNVPLTLDKYKKKFPKFSIGAPSYSPPPEAVQRLREANPKFMEKPAPPTEEEVSSKAQADEARFQERVEELWNLCERDPAARTICFAAAKDELMLDDAYAEIERLRKSPKLDSDALKAINAHLDSTNKRLTANLTSLSLTVKQRRDSNQLGTDSVSQIIGGYANTRRKMSPEKQDAFDRRIEVVMANMQERVRVSILEEVDMSFDQATEAIVDEHDFRAAILKFKPS